MSSVLLISILKKMYGDFILWIPITATGMKIHYRTIWIQSTRVPSLAMAVQ